MHDIVKIVFFILILVIRAMDKAITKAKEFATMSSSEKLQDAKKEEEKSDEKVKDEL